MWWQHFISVWTATFCSPCLTGDGEGVRRRRTVADPCSDELASLYITKKIFIACILVHHRKIYRYPVRQVPCITERITYTSLSLFLSLGCGIRYITEKYTWQLVVASRYGTMHHRNIYLDIIEFFLPPAQVLYTGTLYGTMHHRKNYLHIREKYLSRGLCTSQKKYSRQSVPYIPHRYITEESLTDHGKNINHLCSVYITDKIFPVPYEVLSRIIWTS